MTKIVRGKKTLISLIVITALLLTLVLCSILVHGNETHRCHTCEEQVAMVPAILILTLATALKNTTSLLGAKYFVANLLEGAGALRMFLPAIIFLIACALSFATGTSWGTFGILLPIVLAIFTPGTELYAIGMSACLAGAVCGDHCSPISDTTIMASAGAQCNHVEHVATQLPYAVTVAAISFVSFLLAGLIQIVWIVLPLGILLTVGTLIVLRTLQRRRDAGLR